MTKHHKLTDDQYRRIRAVAAQLLTESRLTSSVGHHPPAVLREAAKAVRDIDALAVADIEAVPSPYERVAALETREQDLMRLVHEACEVIRVHARFPTKAGVEAVKDFYRKVGRDEYGQ